MGRNFPKRGSQSPNNYIRENLLSNRPPIVHRKTFNRKIEDTTGENPTRRDKLSGPLQKVLGKTGTSRTGRG